MSLSTQRVCVVVWNEFAHDARVLRTVETLCQRGAHVCVVCIDRGGDVRAEAVSREQFDVIRVPLQSPFSKYLRNVGSFFLRSASGSKLVGRLFNYLGRGTSALGFCIEVLSGYANIYRKAALCSPTIVHANDVNTLAPSWLIARMSGASLIYDAHEISADREGYQWRKLAVRSLESWLSRKASVMITTTATRADWFVRNYGAKDIFVVQNRPNLGLVADIKSRLVVGVPNNKTLVLYQGGLQPGRGLHMLIDAIREIEDVYLMFVGDGSQRRDLENYAADIEDRVIFVGMKPLSELPSWTAMADIGVQTIRNTCFNHYSTDSNKLFEYVAAGLPVVASNFPEIESVVRTWNLGLVVDPDSLEEIRDAISTLSSNKQLRDEFRASAQEAKSQLSWSSQSEELIRAYRRALEHDKPRNCS